MRYPILLRGNSATRSDGGAGADTLVGGAAMMIPCCR